ncbi:enoyl-CoA hydratase/isomerase family protein [Novosphingobium sp.]|uniref:enoyl-CoA hydratase/isomerase family protein n=1 Tax=Novosphingobium sp. TaxID=1874826 RepID=UPI002FE0141F
MNGFEAIEFERDGPIARITLNRPDAGNAITFELARELAHAARLCDMPEIRVVLLTGKGRLFCAGGDLRVMAASGDDASAMVKEVADALHDAIATFARMDAPLVIAVNGPAAGAGFSLALVGDHVLAARSASFATAYVAAGLCPDGSATYYLPRLVGLRRAQELLHTNRRLSAQEAADWGIVTQIVTDETLAGEAEALCQHLATGARGSHAAIKSLLLASPGNGLETQMELEARGIAAAVRSDDGREGIAAFLEKRAPVFGSNQFRQD